MLKFGNSELANGLVLAPLAGFTDSSFRKLCKSFGAELVFSEMASDEGVRRRIKKTLDYILFDDEERPIGIQLFGSKIESMKEAAVIIEKELHPEVIDINLGCPVKKVTKTGAGAALLQDKKKMQKMVCSIVKAVNTPISTKIRLGWKSDDSLELSKMLEDCGISFITIHSRRAIDDYSKKADWTVFEKIKNNTSIPIIANGDIWKPEDAVFLISEIGVDAVMVGRGALGRPWVFKKLKDYMNNGKLENNMSRKDRIDILLKHIEMMRQRMGEEKTARRIKGQIGYYLKGMGETRRAKQQILTANRLSSIVDLLEGMKK